jgi:hypothetical protein
MSKHALITVALILAVSCAGLLPASGAGQGLATGSADWNVYPIYGGDMTALAMAPNDAATLYVGTEIAGIFKSTDSAATWQAARTGLPYSSILSVRVDPGHANVLLAGTSGAGLWRSVDGGASWIKAGTGIETGIAVHDTIFNPANTSIVYALVGDLYYRSDIYKSTDNGIHWDLSDQDIPRNSDGQHARGITMLAIDPSAPLVLYAATNDSGVYKTTDGGLTWLPINGGIPQSGGAYASVTGIALDPLHSNQPVAIINRNYCSYAANTWTKINTSYAYFSGPPDHIYFHPTDPDVIYVAGRGISKSIDGGLTWNEPNVPGGDVSDMAFPASNPNRLYAAGSIQTSGATPAPGGVMLSTNAGLTWAPANSGISATNLHAIGVDPQAPDRIYVGTSDWANSGVWRSQNRGATWEFVTYFSEEVNAIAVDPLNSQKVYVADTGGLMISTDAGATYQKINEVTNGARSLAVTPGASSPVYVGTGQGVFRSADGGLNWQAKNTGLPLTGSFVPVAVDSLAVDPNAPATVWAGTEGQGLVRTVNSADSWEVRAFGANTNAITAIAVRPGNGNVLLVGIGYDYATGSIYKSADGGLTWQLKWRGQGRVSSIKYDPRDPESLFAATYDPWANDGAPSNGVLKSSGMLRSLDGGEQWYGDNSGLYYPQVYDLGISGTGEPLLLAATGGGHSGGSGLWGTQPARGYRVHLPEMQRP